VCSMGSRRIADATTSFAVPLFLADWPFFCSTSTMESSAMGSVDRAFLNRIWLDLVEIELARLRSRAPPI
jgi:hypothetical protein